MSGRSAGVTDGGGCYQGAPGRRRTGNAPRQARLLATTATVIAGFVIGGIALPIGPTWWLFWIGAGMVVLGAIIGAAVHVFDDWY